MIFCVEPADNEHDLVAPLMHAKNVADPQRLPALGCPQMVDLDARECVNKQIFQCCVSGTYTSLTLSGWLTQGTMMESTFGWRDS